MANSPRPGNNDQEKNTRGMERNLQTVQRNASLQRHDSIPAVAAIIDLSAEAYAAKVTFGEDGVCEDGS